MTFYHGEYSSLLTTPLFGLWLLPLLFTSKTEQEAGINRPDHLGTKVSLPRFTLVITADDQGHSTGLLTKGII